jgi:hypothetical protein
VIVTDGLNIVIASAVNGSHRPLGVVSGGGMAPPLAVSLAAAT